MRVKSTETPATSSDRMEKVAKDAAQKLFNTRKKLLEGIGERPFKGLPVDQHERLARYQTVRDDPVEMTNLLRENVRVKEDGRVLIRKGLVQTMLQMEGELRGGTL